jgi:cobalt-zinc-cadmium efflux system protein
MQKAANVRGVKIALINYCILSVLQLFAYFMSENLALLSMCFETLASLLIAALLLIAANYSKKPANDTFMFGYERTQNLAAVFAAVIFINVMSFEIFRQAIPKFFTASDVTQVPNLNLSLIISGLSISLAFIPIVDILRTPQKGASLKAQLISSIEDVASYLGGMIGLLLFSRGYYLAEPITSVLVGLVIALSGLFLIKDNVGYLIGKGPGREYLKKVVSIVKLGKGVLDIHGLKASYVGPDDVVMGFQIKVARDTPVGEAAKIVHEIKNNIRQEMGCRYCTIEVDSDE